MTEMKPSRAARAADSGTASIHSNAGERPRAGRLGLSWSAATALICLSRQGIRALRCRHHARVGGHAAADRG